jgi:hypothetical protein
MHDRKFFARLLKKPREAMRATAFEGTLKLSKADKDRVVELIEVNRAAHSNAELMAMWKRYHRTGAAASGIWKGLSLWKWH